MEIREFALALLRAETLDGKLAPPLSDLGDQSPGETLRIDAPSRPRDLQIVPSSEARVPAIGGMPDPTQRKRILHALANHELQAAELFAWALLAWPDAPPSFRRGLLGILIEEQEHCRLYLGRLDAMGGRFGDYPVSGYFWSKVEDLTTPLHFVCAMALTFESANLDHAEDHAAAARACGDHETAAVILRIHEDEIGHVRFGWRWLQRWKKPDQSMADAYLANVTWPLRPAKARGRVFHEESRVAAGMDPEFIRLLRAAGA